MPWRTMRLRDATVLARCDDEGALRVRGGRVEVRYGPTSPKAYAASPRNLEAIEGGAVYPDAHCVDAAPAAKAGGRKSKAASRAPAGVKSASKPPTEPRGDEVLAYADGACSGNPGPAGLGVVLRHDGRSRCLSEYLGRATNNVAELTGILRALEATPDPARPLRIYTDSTYAIGVLTKGWKPKKNVELIAEIREALDGLDDVRIHHVPGHAGVELNDLADNLAVQAVKSRRSTGWTE